MCLIPLWNKVQINEQRDKENRATVFFFQIVAQQFEPLQLIFKKHAIFRENVFALPTQKVELMARQIRFFIHRLANRTAPDFDQPVQENLAIWIYRLDFASHYLKFVPEEVGLFESLRDLDLAKCELTEIPSSIGKLKKLRSLNIAGNKIKELPTTLANCPELQLIYLAGNQFSSSSLLDLAKDFLANNNALGALQLISKVIDIIEAQEDETIYDIYDDMPISQYSEVIKLFGTIAENFLYKGISNDDITVHIVTIINKIPAASDRYDCFLECLKGTKITCCPEDLYYDELIAFREILINKCLEAVDYSVIIDRHQAFCELVKALFLIDHPMKAIEVAKEVIRRANCRPDYHALTMVYDAKGAELENISRILKEASDKLIQLGNVAIVARIAEIKSTLPKI